MQKLIILAAILLAGCAGVPASVASDEDAEAFAAFKNFIAQCRDAGGCTVIATPNFNRSRMAAYFKGVAHGKETCGKGDL